MTSSGRRESAPTAALVLAGIHAGESDLDGLYERYGARPDHVLERFAW